MFAIPDSVSNLLLKMNQKVSMTNLEPHQPISRLGFVLSTGNSQRCKEEDTVPIVGSKEVAEQHEE